MSPALIPSYLLRRLSPDPNVQRDLNVLISLVALCCLFFATDLLSWLEQIPHVCIVQAFAGTPCPGCGMTRALQGLARGDVHAAWILNPASVLIAAFLGFESALRLLRLAGGLQAPHVEGMSRRLDRAILAVFGVLFLIRLLHLDPGGNDGLSALVSQVHHPRH